MRPNAALINDLRELSRPATPELPALPSAFTVRVDHPLPRTPSAVLFDIYGTLFTSGSGDIGVADTTDRSVAVADAFRRVTGTVLSPLVARDIAARFRETIELDHTRKRSRELPVPEVDVREIWPQAFPSSIRLNEPAQVARFAVCYEALANPVWPMPGLVVAAQAVRRAIPIGIVSNAQFYTPLLFPALLRRTLDDLGFHRGLRAFSYAFGFAKPDHRLFAGPLAVLAAQGIDSSRVVYVGNDMRNDVTTARAAGCMTVLFAGDRRSLRLRTDDPGGAGMMPDSVITSLTDLIGLVV